MRPNNSLFSSGKEFREVDFGTNLHNLQTKYLDMYEGIQLDIGAPASLMRIQILAQLIWVK